jgi:hypothetical protein
LGLVVIVFVGYWAWRRSHLEASRSRQGHAGGATLPESYRRPRAGVLR